MGGLSFYVSKRRHLLIVGIDQVLGGKTRTSPFQVVALKCGVPWRTESLKNFASTAPSGPSCSRKYSSSCLPPQNTLPLFTLWFYQRQWYALLRSMHSWERWHCSACILRAWLLVHSFFSRKGLSRIITDHSWTHCRPSCSTTKRPKYVEDRQMPSVAYLTGICYYLSLDTNNLTHS